ncbi:unnamed protein product [Effrenium voratum]|nr:unnamed protein product [Effrenium voratum]
MRLLFALLPVGHCSYSDSLILLQQRYYQCAGAGRSTWVGGAERPCCAGLAKVEKGSSSYCTAVEQTADCLCVFDIDRTLTARQNASTSCPGTRELDIWDYSYGGGKVLLSALSVAGINSTFCDNCYLGICSAGNGSGVTSAWNQFLLEQVMRSKAQDALSEQFAFVKQWTLGSRVNSPYVLMQPEGTKHRAAEKIRRWYEDQFGFQLERSKVYTFDDKVENIQSFAYSGLSSKQVSCASRHEEFVQDLGLCGARPEEILPQAGDMKAEVGAIRTLSNIYLASDMPGESVRAANEAVQLSKRVHDRRQLAENLILSSEANIALAMQDNPKGLAKGSERSLKPAREAFKVAKSIGAGKLMGMAMHQTAYVLLVTVKPDDALKSAREAVDIFRQVDERAREAGATRESAGSVILIAEIYHSKSEDEKALDAANEGLMLAKACGDPKKERDANKLIEQIAGKRFAYYQPYPGEGGEMPMPAQAAGGGPADAAASAVAAPKQVGLEAAMVQATVQEMAKQAIGVDDELFLDSALMDSGMAPLALSVLPSSLMFDYPTMKEVSNRIVELSIENERAAAEELLRASPGPKKILLGPWAEGDLCSMGDLPAFFGWKVLQTTSFAVLRKTGQMRIECVKVCAPAQLPELIEGAHGVMALA